MPIWGKVSGRNYETATGRGSAGGSHVAGHNLGILTRHLIGAGTPKEAAARDRAFLFVHYRNATSAIVVFALDEAGLSILVVTVTPRAMITTTSSTGC